MSRTDYRYGMEVREFDLGSYGDILHARWLHPLEGRGKFSRILNEKHIKTLAKFIPEGSVVLDIGAQTGDTTLPYAYAVGKQGAVIAFEPNPRAYDILNQNALLNTDYEIVCVNRAITAQPGTFTFHYCDPDCLNGGFAEALDAGVGVTNHFYPLEVKGVNLEAWLNENYPSYIERIKFFKIDAEGYDKEILKSIKNLLNRLRPLIQVELYVGLRPEERADLYHTIRALGYQPFDFLAIGHDIDSLPAEPIQLEDCLRLAQEHITDLLCIPEEHPLMQSSTQHA